MNGLLRMGHDTRWAYYSDEAPPERAAAMPDEGGARYRYAMGWVWRSGLDILLWVMLNPSTATHLELDPTLRRCESFSRRWGYDGMIIMNAYAYRSTNPKLLARLDQRTNTIAIGPACDYILRTVASAGRDVVFGWGKHCGTDRATQVASLFSTCRRVDCLGTNKDGSPKHPLYVAGVTERRPWSSAA